MRCTIVVDLEFDGDETDRGLVKKYLEAIFELGAESSCTDLELVEIISLDDSPA